MIFSELVCCPAGGSYNGKWITTLEDLNVEVWDFFVRNLLKQTAVALFALSLHLDS